MKLKVTVLLPVHNAEAFLPEAVESILGQSLSDLELVCIDDGSTDRSPEILQRYAARDGRVRVFRREHAGLIAALNEGLRIARAPLVARMDADDISTPERLEHQYRRLEMDPELWVLGTAEERIDAAGRARGRRPPIVTGCDAVARALLEKCVICHPSVMMRREPILALGGYRPAYKHAEDYDLWLRVSERAKLDNLDFVGLRYRKHDGGISQRCSPRQRLSTALAQATHALRSQELPDPTDGMTAEPDLWTCSILDTLVPTHVEFFRMLAIAFSVSERDFDADRFERRLRSQSSDLVTQNSWLFLAALVRIIKRRALIDPLSFRLAMMSLRMNPGRFLKLLFAWNRTKPHLVWD